MSLFDQGKKNKEDSEQEGSDIIYSLYRHSVSHI